MLPHPRTPPPPPPLVDHLLLLPHGAWAHILEATVLRHKSTGVLYFSHLHCLYILCGGIYLIGTYSPSVLYTQYRSPFFFLFFLHHPAKAKYRTWSEYLLYIIPRLSSFLYFGSIYLFYLLVFIGQNPTASRSKVDHFIWSYFEIICPLNGWRVGYLLGGWFTAKLYTQDEKYEYSLKYIVVLVKIM